MKFAEHLAAHITPEWRKQYINYKEMSKMLEAALKEKQEVEVTGKRYSVSKFDEKFLKYCAEDLKKIDTFYAEKLAEANRKFTNLKNDITNFEQIQQADETYSLPRRKMKELKLAFSEFYLCLVLLQNYQTMNHTGFKSIMKKHDKTLKTNSGMRWINQNVEKANIFTSKEIEALIDECEVTFADKLEGGNRSKAMKRLRVPPVGETVSLWSAFKVGLFSGSFIVLFIVVVFSAHRSRKSLKVMKCIVEYLNYAGKVVSLVFIELFSEIFALGELTMSFNHYNIKKPMSHNGAKYYKGAAEELLGAFRIYRGPLLFIVFIFLIGINIYGWRSAGVNHVLIFELDPRNHLNDLHLMEIAALMGVIWALSLIGFVYGERYGVPLYLSPLVLMALYVAFLLCPLKIFKYNARFWLLKRLMRIIAAPFEPVQFADFWLADQMTSLADVLTDFHYMAYFYLTEDFMQHHEMEGELHSYNHMPTIYDFEDTDMYVITRGLAYVYPSVARFLQCLRRYRDSKEMFPHLVNAGKYSTTFFVVVFATLMINYKNDYTRNVDNPYLKCWIFCKLVSSVYSYTWDIKIDWGLFSKHAEKKFLREELVYRHSFYYFAIVEDFVLRFFWSVTVPLTHVYFVNIDVIMTISATLEVFRRFIWNFLRLENEHLNNCGKFRAVREIYVTPISDQDRQLLAMIENEPDSEVYDVCLALRLGPTTGFKNFNL